MHIFHAFVLIMSTLKDVPLNIRVLRHEKCSYGQAGLKAMRSSYLDRQNSWDLIKKCETEVPIKKACASASINCTQFHLTLAWASTV